ncbi:MAG: hypothetical protein WCA08_08570 [Desulfoferrobacter sp.]
MRRKAIGLVLLSVILGSYGCCGQVKQAAIDHAEATRGVAMTLQASVPKIDCAGMPDSNEFKECQAALAAIKTQIPALNRAADRLESAAR